MLVQATGSASLDPAAIGVGEVERGEGWRWVELGGSGIIEAESSSLANEVDLAREPWTSLSSKLPWFWRAFGVWQMCHKNAAQRNKTDKSYFRNRRVHQLTF